MQKATVMKGVGAAREEEEEEEEIKLLLPLVVALVLFRGTNEICPAAMPR